MPTPAQVTNRTRPVEAPDRHYTATVSALGPPLTVALDPGGAQTSARALTGDTYTVGQRVLVLSTTAGNYVLGRIS